MAVVKRRYVFRGPSDQTIAAEVGPSVVLFLPVFYLAADVQFDDGVADIATVDALMSRQGYAPEPVPTLALAPAPFLGIVSPLGDVFRLDVNAVGVLTTLKVN